VRRAVDLVLAGTLVAVVALAALDALRPAPGDAVAAASRELGAAGVAGRLVVAAPDCSRRELELPSLRERPLGVISCSVYGRPGSLAVYRGGVVWYAFAGGTTTLLRGPELDAYLGRRARVLLVAWLGNVRFAAAYRVAGRPGETLAIFERGRLVRVVARAQAFDDLRSSPRTRFFATRAGGRLALYDVLGDHLALPREAARANALAWSPGERWAVAAGDDRLAVFEPRTARVVARIPVGGVDVSWSAP
jgi:hypothetical protein